MFDALFVSRLVWLGLVNYCSFSDRCRWFFFLLDPSAVSLFSLPPPECVACHVPCFISCGAGAGCAVNMYDCFFFSLFCLLGLCPCHGLPSRDDSVILFLEVFLLGVFFYKPRTWVSIAFIFGCQLLTIAVTFLTATPVKCCSDQTMLQTARPATGLRSPIRAPQGRLCRKHCRLLKPAAAAMAEDLLIRRPADPRDFMVREEELHTTQFKVAFWFSDAVPLISSKK